MSLYDYDISARSGQRVVIEATVQSLCATADTLDDLGLTVMTTPSLEYLVWSRMPCHDPSLGDASAQEGHRG